MTEAALLIDFSKSTNILVAFTPPATSPAPKAVPVATAATPTVERALPTLEVIEEPIPVTELPNFPTSEDAFEKAEESLLMSPTIFTVSSPTADIFTPYGIFRLRQSMRFHNPDGVLILLYWV